MKLQLFTLILFASQILFAFSLGACTEKEVPIEDPVPVSYFVDSENGNDNNSGTSEALPWKSLSRIEKTELKPGDMVRFKRGSTFTGPLLMENSGNIDKYITITDYGAHQSPAPSFTNPVFVQGNFGNCIRIKGNYVIISNLYFHHTSAYVPGYYQTDGWITWEMGAVYIDKGANNRFQWNSYSTSICPGYWGI